LKHRKTFDVFLTILMFFHIISVLDEIHRKKSTDLFVKYFCEFFDTPGVPGGVFWSTGEILPSWLDV
jgi:hypothetical protein